MSSEKNHENLEMVSTPELHPERNVGNQKFWHIDKEMLYFKIHYFLFIGACAACWPYITIFAESRVGISASALAAILTAQQLILIFSKPLLGYIADYFNRLKTIIFIISVVMTVFFFVLLAIPNIEKGTNQARLHQVQENTTHFELLNTSDDYVVCVSVQNISSVPVEDLFFNNSKHVCDAQSFQYFDLDNLSKFLYKCFENTRNCSEKEINNTDITSLLEQTVNAESSQTNIRLYKACCKLAKQCQSIECESVRNVTIDGESVSEFQTSQFWLFAIFSTISMICLNSLFTLTDTACCESVQKTGSQYGRQRLWGEIGWSVMSPISGLLNDYTGDFLASWLLMAILSFLSLLNMMKLKMVNPQFSENLLKDVGSVLASKKFLAFMFCVLLNGIGSGFIWYFLVLFLTDIGGSRFLCGMALLVQGCSELPFMFFSGWVVKKIGHFNVLSVSLTAYIVRFLWYSQMHDPWLVLPAEVLHGITYGLVYTNIASFAKISAKPGTEATTQSVLFTTHDAIGVGIGCILAGLGFDSIGGHRTFLYLSISAGFAVVLSIILHLFIRHHISSTSSTS